MLFADRRARHRGIPLVEDCAQAPGARVNGRLVGTFGDIAAFSTMFGKHYCTGGQGGVVYTRREELYPNLRRAADRGKPFGLPPGSTNCLASLNFNLDEFGAAIGRAQLRKLPGIVRRRQAVVARLRAALAGLQTVFIPVPAPGVEPSYWFLRVGLRRERLACDRATYCNALAAEGIPFSPSYRNALPHLQAWFQERRVFGQSGYPWAAPGYRGDRQRQFPYGPVRSRGLIGRMLRKHPNLYCDLSAGSGCRALDRDRVFALDFLLEFQDRVLYARDYFDNRHQEVIEALGLPGAVRSKIYAGNALKLVPLQA